MNNTFDEITTTMICAWPVLTLMVFYHRSLEFLGFKRILLAKFAVSGAGGAV